MIWSATSGGIPSPKSESRWSEWLGTSIIEGKLWIPTKKSPSKRIDILERMAVTSKRQANASRRAKTAASAKSVDYETHKRFYAMEIYMTRLGRPSGKDVVNVSQAYPVCDRCEELGHVMANCPREQGKLEEVNHLGGERRQKYTTATHYHPGLRNHPNLRYGNASNQLNPNSQGANMQCGRHPQKQQYQNRKQGYNQGYQRGSDELGGGQFNSLIDAIKGLNKENEDAFKDLRKDNEVRDKTVNALHKQFGQLAEEMSKRDPGKLPSTTYEESDSEEECKQGAPLIPIKVGGVKVRDFYYPEDFLVLDYAPSQKKEPCLEDHSWRLPVPP
ncbi:hypothetical protein L1987_54816 [Smallanthus sonchifolius]|uniref:Uncharacterized protein n=1 Tax=Smallanthus sonchifolius TaxID=185202 RepID=A0ACB9E8U9_9ASTR|nr:hypothetical protein L1987_54816 [Smallanthus sonchifolius]